jgi:hypothetical protein
MRVFLLFVIAIVSLVTANKSRLGKKVEKEQGIGTFIGGGIAAVVAKKALTNTRIV